MLGKEQTFNLCLSWEKKTHKQTNQQTNRQTQQRTWGLGDITGKGKAQGRKRQFCFPQPINVQMMEQVHIQHVITRKLPPV